MNSPSIELSASELASRPRRRLARRPPHKADLFLYRLGGQEVLLKTYRPKSGPWRELGVLLSGREARALRRLQGVEGVPAFRGRPDRYSVAMSYVQGRPARRAVGELPDSRAFVRALEGTVRQMHRRGVVHLDLKHRSNLLVTEQGDPLVLDFESAVRFNPRSLVGRAAVALLGQFDWLAVANWKRRLCPQMLRASPGARRRARLARRLRGAWLPRRIIDVFVDLLVRPRWRGGPGSS